MSTDELFAHLALRQIRLLDFHAHLEIKENEPPRETKVSVRVDGGINENESRLLLNLVVQMDGRPKGGDQDSSNLKIHADYQAVFEIRDVPPKVVVERPEALGVVAKVFLWPYMRELVQSTTARMGIPSFTLPIYVPQGHASPLTTASPD